MNRKNLLRHVLLTASDLIRNSLLSVLGGKSVGVRALVLNQAGEVLLVRHTYRSGLETPGGGVHSGESPLKAIIRELREEVGIEVNGTPTIFGAYRNVWRGIDDYPILFVVRDYDGVPYPNDSTEIADVVWVSPENMSEEITIKTTKRLREFWGEAPVSDTW